MKGIDSYALRQKRILITGATGHLGSAMVGALAEAGAHVLINARTEVRCHELATQICSQGYSAEAAVFDVRSPKAVSEFFASQTGLPLHGLVNNAFAGAGAGGVSGGGIEESNDESFVFGFDIALVAANRVMRGSLGCLREAVRLAGDASVINIASMYALVSPDQRIYGSRQGVNPPSYGVATAALLQWTRYAACEFGAEGIRVNAISPGAFPPTTVQEKHPELMEKLKSRIPLGRIGCADEIKGPTLFLASRLSSFVTGANIVVDGGWTAW